MVGLLGLGLLLLRLWIRRTLESGGTGTTVRIASGESVLHANAGALRPDAEVVARVDPEHPARLTVDWAQTMRAPDAR